MEVRVTKNSLPLIQERFPFLVMWTPELSTAERPVTFSVMGPKEPIPSSFRLEYGRYNNDVCTDYTVGVESVAIYGDDLKWISLSEGETFLDELLDQSTRYILVDDQYVSMLIYNDPGSRNYRLYEVAPTLYGELMDSIRQRLDPESTESVVEEE